MSKVEKAYDRKGKFITCVSDIHTSYYTHHMITGAIEFVHCDEIILVQSVGGDGHISFPQAMKVI